MRKMINELNRASVKFGARINMEKTNIVFNKATVRYDVKIYCKELRLVKELKQLSEIMQMKFWNFVIE